MSRLLELPSPLLHEIYDVLEIEDRTSLNTALPKALKVTRTLRMSASHDRFLRVAAAHFRRRRLAPGRPESLNLGTAFRRYMSAHADCPTMRRIREAFEEDVVRPDVPGGTPLSERLAYDAVEHLLAAVTRRDAAAVAAFSTSAPMLAVAAEAPPGCDPTRLIVGHAARMEDCMFQAIKAASAGGCDARDVLEALAGGASPEATALFADELGRCRPGWFLWRLVNHGRRQLLMHIMSRPDPDHRARLGAAAADVQEMLTLSGAGGVLLCELYLEVFGGMLAVEVVDALLDQAIAEMNMSAAEKLIKLLPAI